MFINVVSSFYTFYPQGLNKPTETNINLRLALKLPIWVDSAVKPYINIY